MRETAGDFDDENVINRWRPRHNYKRRVGNKSIEVVRVVHRGRGVLWVIDVGRKMKEIYVKVV